MEYLTEELMKDMENEVVDVPQNTDWRVVFTEGIQQVEDTLNSVLELYNEIPMYFNSQYQQQESSMEDRISINRRMFIER